MYRSFIRLSAGIGAIMLIASACSSSATAPSAPISATPIHRAAECDMDSRTGYFVRAGKSYTDSDCTVEVPN